MQRAEQRALVRKYPMYAFHSLPHILGGSKRECDVDSPNYQHPLFVLYLAANIGCEPAFARVDFARFQRAAESAQHSAGGCGNDVVDRGRV